MSDCKTCDAIARKIRLQAVLDLSNLVNKTITTDDKKHIPASIVLAQYINEGMETLYKAVEIEVAKDIESGTSVEEATKLFPEVIEAMMLMVGEAFEVDVETRAVDPKDMDTIAEALDGMKSGVASEKKVH